MNGTSENVGQSSLDNEFAQQAVLLGICNSHGDIVSTQVGTMQLSFLHSFRQYSSQNHVLACACFPFISHMFHHECRLLDQRKIYVHVFLTTLLMLLTCAAALCRMLSNPYMAARHIPALTAVFQETGYPKLAASLDQQQFAVALGGGGMLLMYNKV